MRNYVLALFSPHESFIKYGTIVTNKYPSNSLIALAVKKLKLPSRHADGNDFYLVIDLSGTRRWMQRLMADGKRRDIGVGNDRIVPLDLA